MQFFDVGEEAFGVIAIGQFATGVIAIGQVATGVIAIGQIARGFFAFGQASIGLVAVGMAAVGVFHGTAMLGLGGRGLGIVLPLIPTLPKRYRYPQEEDPNRLFSGAVRKGWIEATLNEVGGIPGLVKNNQPIRMRFAKEIWPAVCTAANRETHKVMALIEWTDGGPVCTGMMKVLPSTYSRPGPWILAAVQLMGLAAICFVFWILAAYPILHDVFGLF